MLRQKSDIMHAHLDQLLPRARVFVLFQHHALFRIILPVDVAEDLRDELVRILEVLIGRRARHATGLRHAPRGKVLHAIFVQLLQSGKDQRLRVLFPRLFSVASIDTLLLPVFYLFYAIFHLPSIKISVNVSLTNYEIMV